MWVDKHGRITGTTAAPNPPAPTEGGSVIEISEEDLAGIAKDGFSAFAVENGQAAKRPQLEIDQIKEKKENKQDAKVAAARGHRLLDGWTAPILFQHSIVMMKPMGILVSALVKKDPALAAELKENLEELDAFIEAADNFVSLYHSTGVENLKTISDQVDHVWRASRVKVPGRELELQVEKAFWTDLNYPKVERIGASTVRTLGDYVSTDDGNFFVKVEKRVLIEPSRAVGTGGYYSRIGIATIETLTPVKIDGKQTWEIKLKDIVSFETGLPWLLSGAGNEYYLLGEKERYEYGVPVRTGLSE